MIVTHLYAIIPLLVLLIISLVWYGKGLLHLMTFGYNATLAFVAITNNWELLFSPLLAVTAIISLILFGFAMSRGGWL